MKGLVILIAFKVAVFLSQNATYNANLTSQINTVQVSQENEPGIHVSIPVEVVMQMPELPNGCEVTALVAALHYKGIDVDKCVVSDNYLPKSTNVWFGDPNENFIGDPRSLLSGYYCYENPLIKTIDNMNQATGSRVSYTNLSNQDVLKLYREVQKGNPVIVWTTREWDSPRTMTDGKQANLHCVVLSGYTDSSVTIVDSLKGIYKVDRAKFENIWRESGSHAMSVW